MDNAQSAGAKKSCGGSIPLPAPSRITGNILGAVQHSIRPNRIQFYKLPRYVLINSGKPAERSPV